MESKNFQEEVNIQSIFSILGVEKSKKLSVMIELADLHYNAYRENVNSIMDFLYYEKSAFEDELEICKEDTKGVKNCDKFQKTINILDQMIQHVQDMLYVMPSTSEILKTE